MLYDGREVILSLYSGSHLHGTNTPESDLDVRGVVWPLENEVFGLKKFEQIEKTGNEDVVFYSLPYYIHLLVNKGNPNVHEWLWALEYQCMTEVGKEICSLKDHWVSGKVFACGLGYLNSQTKRMLHIASIRDLGEKRKKLVEKFGYDTKNAAHAVRIARELRELADTGIMRVRRDTDREELISIRNGKLGIEQAQRLVVEETIKVEEAIKLNRAGIRDKPDTKFADEWLTAVMKKHFSEEK